jgi:hypothetical protein
MANTAAVIAQLRTLEQLTRTEIRIARLRVAQARTEAVRRELEENGDNASRRAERLATALHDLDAVPDVVAPVVGRAAALVKSTVEQAQPLDEGSRRTPSASPEPDPCARPHRWPRERAHFALDPAPQAGSALRCVRR